MSSRWRNSKPPRAALRPTVAFTASITRRASSSRCRGVNLGLLCPGTVPSLSGPLTAPRCFRQSPMHTNTSGDNTIHIYYHPTYNAGRNDSETTRKSAHIARSLQADPIPGVTLTSPMQFATEAEDLARTAHSGEYLDAVRTGAPDDLARSNGLAWCPDVYRMAIAHSAGMVAAVDTAVTGSTTAGSLSSGLHHASRLSGMGFCTINGIAVALLAA
ncbi:MAG: hypothetical protein ACKOD2_13245, partial [Ilumatobacteraceae bacterium]